MLDAVSEYPYPYYDAEPKTTAHAGSTEGQVADDLIKRLAALKAANPTWAYTDGRIYYLGLANWYRTQLQAADPKESAAYRRQLATCYFMLSQHEQWEDCIEALREMTPRAIEKSLRWDGRPNTYAAENRDLVTRYLSDRRPLREGGE